MIIYVKMILVLTNKKTSRIYYIFSLILKELLGLDFEITTDNDYFKSFEGPKFVYGIKKFEDFPFQQGTKLLFEHTIVSQSLYSVSYRDMKVFFPVNSRDSILPFDIFAASFYLVSRYEEYLPTCRDAHDRFRAEDSILAQLDILEKPVVNLWADDFFEQLKAIYPSLEKKKTHFIFQPTYDIDSAWAYKNKGFLRTLGAFCRDFLQRNFQEIRCRWRVLLNKEKDPFDTFDLQLEYQKKYNFKAKYFVLIGDYNMNDKNISPRNIPFQNLIKHLGDYADVGLHPSYSSYLKKKVVEQEVNRLSQILHCETTVSRQHFLRLRLPLTYQLLDSLDISDDYTMGYAERVGFRAGIASTFKFFDLENDTPTKLNIHPFAVMDGTLRDYLKLNNDEAYKKIETLIDAVKAVDGTFILIWHNETLSNIKRWTGWNDIYEKALAYGFSTQSTN